MTAWFECRLPTVEEISERLELAIPQEVDPRRYARREMAAKTIFVMLYSCAVEGTGRWIRPTAVTDMTDEQSRRLDVDERKGWLDLVQGRNRPRHIPGRWYQENTREPIRDETIRILMDLGIVVDRSGIPTTSPKPRYALAEDFVELLDPMLDSSALKPLAERWREQHLTPAAQARIRLSRSSLGSRDKRVLIHFPNRETRSLAPGPSSRLTKAVIEEFAPRFLVNPVPVLISESARKIHYQDREILERIELHIQPGRVLPDVLLVDIGIEPLLLVFVEVVVTDGAIDARRLQALERIATADGFEPKHCAFVSAFRDRSRQEFRVATSSLAWRSFAWFQAEPDNIVYLREPRGTSGARLADLIRS